MATQPESLSVGLPTSSFLPAIGGAEVGLHNIATRLLARGHRPVVITPTPHLRELRREGWEQVYPVIAFPPKVWGVLRHWPDFGYRILDGAFGRIAKRFGIDVWHGTIGYPVGVALCHYATARNQPHLVRCAGEDIQVDREIGYGMRLDPRIDEQIRRWLPRADRLVAITESVADEYRAIGADDARIAHVPNGVDTGRFEIEPDRAAVRAAHGIDPDAFLFLCVGRNHPKKNFPALVDAFAALDRPDARLAIVGQDVSELKSADGVHLIEPVREDRAPDARTELPSDSLVALYRSADAFVFPSRLETFGIVLVEAMAAGLPVITTDAPGCRDVVRADTDGLSVSPDDIAGMAAAMRDLMDDSDLRARLSAAARQRAEAFSWDKVTDRYVALYREMIDERADAAQSAAA